MTNDEYLVVQQQILLVAGLVRPMPLAGFRNRLNRADTIGPILDPTLWMRARPGVEDLEQLAEALQDFQVEVERVAQRALARTTKGGGA